jgi:hypothetical protein
LNKLFACLAILFFLIGCGGSDGGSGNQTGGNYPVCSKLNASIDGAGGVEDYLLFPSFDSSGATLSHTIGKISYVTVTEGELKELRERLAKAGYVNYFGANSYYEKCAVEEGMHALAEIGDEGDKYRLELTLYGNGGFVPNDDKFEEVFGKISSASVGFFYVWRNYNENMSARFDAYKYFSDSDGFSCVNAWCGRDNPTRWFNIYGSTTIDWHIDYYGN